MPDARSSGHHVLSSDEYPKTRTYHAPGMLPGRERALDATAYADAKEDHFRHHRPRIVDDATGIARGQTFVSSAMQGSIDAVCELCAVSPSAAEQALRYHAAQVAAVGCVPTRKRFVFERFFDETGGMQLVIHAPLGMRINRAWGLALRKRFCRSFDFELQAQADENGILLSLSPQHSFPLEMMPGLVAPDVARPLLEQAVLAAPAFQARWRWNATRALGVLRMRNGQKLPPHLLRHRAEDLLAAVFPDATGCFENHHGDKEIPDHPLIRQTMDDCLTEAMDFAGWHAVLEELAAGSIELVMRQTREPSPFSHGLIHSMPYTFLDPAGLEERRTRAVATRRSLDVANVADLAMLDAEAVRVTVAEAALKIRDAEELHDALLGQVVMTDAEVRPHAEALFRLTAAGRVRSVVVLTDPRREPATFWTTAERWPTVRAAYGKTLVPQEGDDATTVPTDRPAGAADPPEVDSARATVALVRGRVRRAGPVTAQALVRATGLAEDVVRAALEAIEGEGLILRGWYTVVPPDGPAGDTRTARAVEWCERTMLTTMHRRTLRRSRDAIRPVEVPDYLHFLATYHGLDGGPGLGWDDDPAMLLLPRDAAPAKREKSARDPARATRVARLRRVLARLEGFEAPAGAWEAVLLARRVADYAGSDLDRMFLSGELTWGRLPKRVPRPAVTLRRRGRAATAEAPAADAAPTPSPGRSVGVLHRAVPITVCRRATLPTLFETLPAGEAAETPPTEGGVPDSTPGTSPVLGPSSDGRGLPSSREAAEAVERLLTTRGALFTSELAALAKASPAAVEQALRGLAAAGKVTCDSFAAVRHFGRTPARRTGPSDPLARSRRRGAASAGDAMTLMGRWSPFPGPMLIEAEEATDARRRARRALRWAVTLLDRYGVLFRDVLRRERSAPRWGDLVRVLRRLEMQGRVRSGRFIRGVAGEQFALPSTVVALRRAGQDRERGLPDGSLAGQSSPSTTGAGTTASPPWIVVAAVDPVNLWGILTDGERLPAAAAHRFILRAGRLVAWKRGQTITFFAPVTDADRAAMEDALMRGRRPTPPVVTSRADASGRRSRLTRGWTERPADAAVPQGSAWDFWS